MAAKKAPARPRRYATPTVKNARAELAELEQLVDGVTDSVNAALAIAMAKRIDNPDTSASSAASCGRVLLDAMNELRARAPEGDTGDGIDRLAAGIAARIAAS